MDQDSDHSAQEGEIVSVASFHDAQNAEESVPEASEDAQGSAMNPLDFNQAARKGDINALYTAIRSDPSAIAMLGTIPFSTTPLHIAAAFGQTHFALEMMILKPSLAAKLNEEGYTPLHIALRSGEDDVIRGMCSRQKDLLRVKGKDGHTPLHSMVIQGGTLSLIREMVSACPDSLKDITDKRESVLHLAVKNNKHEVFQVLVECIKKFHKEEIFSWLDEENHTPLHLLTKEVHIETIKMMFKCYRHKEWDLGVDVLDGHCHTALDMVYRLPRTHEHRDTLIDILALGSLEDIIKSEYNAGMSSYYRYWGYFMNELIQAVHKMPKEKRKTLLVVLTFVAMASFQVGMNPPGGFWQNNVPFNSFTDPTDIFPGTDATTEEGYKYYAGTAIMASSYPTMYFFVCLFTMAGFISSTTMIWVLTRGISMKYLLDVALFCMAKSYIMAFIAVTRKQIGVTIAICALVTVLVGLTSTIYVRRFMRLKVVPALLEKHNSSLGKVGDV